MMEELVSQFAIEARELVQQASEDLLALEADPGKRESLESAFRAMHTLKGSAGLFDLGPMQGILHHAEELLSQARSGRIVVNAALIDPLMAVIDWVDDSIEGIAQTGRLPEAQEKQAPRLLALLDGEITERDGADVTIGSGTLPEWARALQGRVPSSAAGMAMVEIRYEPHPECFFNGDDPLVLVAKLPDLQHLAVTLKKPQPEPQ